MVFIHSRLIKSKQVRFQIFNTRHVNCYCSLLLFCVREINRFLEIPFRESKKIFRVSRNSKLDPRFSTLETRASKLDSRFAKTSRIEDRVSSRDCQLTFARYCNVNTLKEFKKFSLTFSNCNPYASVPSVTTDDRK